MKTMICLILDRSGSMAGREGDVIGGVNAFIDEQKKLPDPATIAMVRFDSGAIERFRTMQSLADVQALTAEDYQPRAATPLLDAVGQTINALDQDWAKEQPDRCICVIVTDGQENSSREFKTYTIKKMIQARQESGKWAFIYLGANVDAFAEAGSMGIATANTANYKGTSRGTRAAYSAAGQSVFNMRSNGVMEANLGGDIDEDGSLKKAAAPAQPFVPVPQAAPKPDAIWTPPPRDDGGSSTWSPPPAA